MQHEVIHFFTDLQDNGHPYNVGDKFPRDGLTVSEARLEELSGIDNKQGKPLIRAVEEKPKRGGKKKASLTEQEYQE